jgi:hypothetical protein
MALSYQATQYFLHFGEPIQLHSDDANRYNESKYFDLINVLLRLSSGGRWVSTTVDKIRQSGAINFTFIHPQEQLVGNTSFPYGCFAYLFRQPSDPQENKDRFFPIIAYE